MRGKCLCLLMLLLAMIALPIMGQTFDQAQGYRLEIGDGRPLKCGRFFPLAVLDIACS